MCYSIFLMCISFLNMLSCTKFSIVFIYFNFPLSLAAVSPPFRVFVSQFSSLLFYTIRRLILLFCHCCRYNVVDNSVLSNFNLVFIVTMSCAISFSSVNVACVLLPMLPRLCSVASVVFMCHCSQWRYLVLLRCCFTVYQFHFQIKRKVKNFKVNKETMERAERNDAQ